VEVLPALATAAAPARLGGGAKEARGPAGGFVALGIETESNLFGPIGATDGRPKLGCWLGQMTEANSVGTRGQGSMKLGQQKSIPEFKKQNNDITLQYQNAFFFL